MASKISQRVLRKRGRLDETSSDFLVTYKNENCTEHGLQDTFRHCTRCSQFFCNQCCDLDQHIVKLLNSRADNYWFCPDCAKPALNAVFVEKDIEERCSNFLEAMESKLFSIKRNTGK